MKTPREMEAALAEFLNTHPDRLPFGMRAAEVHWLSGRDRKTASRRRAAARPSPKGDAIYIRLEPAPPRALAAGGESEIADLLRALHQAEHTPGHSFVALKWFRDAYLPAQGLPWADSPEARDRILRAATGRGWIQGYKVPNPRNPGFATSALRVQVGAPEVLRALGWRERLGWDFTPIKIEGEPLSETLRRMRDEEY